MVYYSTRMVVSSLSYSLGKDKKAVMIKFLGNEKNE